MDTDLDPTAIRRIRFDEARRKLFIRFTSGVEYLFVGVPGEVCRSFAKAESKGRFFVKKIRDRYPYNRLDS